MNKCLRISLWGGVGFLFLFFAIPAYTHAATIYLDPQDLFLHKADTKRVSVRIDVDEGECVNAADVVLSYDAGIDVVDVSRGESILSLWVEDPVIDRSLRQVRFAGGIPHGYCGRVPGDPRLSNIIAELQIQAPGMVVGKPAPSTATLNFLPETRLLLNDGLGTDAQLTRTGSTVTVGDGVGTTVINEWQTEIVSDVLPPDPFSIVLARDDTAFGGEYFISFSTTDKQSGIDHYEVYEEPFEELSRFRWGAPDEPNWIETESPYVLKDQYLRSIIRVKVLDKAGNEQIAVLSPDESLRSTTPLEYVTYALLLLLCIAGLFALVAILRFAQRMYLKRTVTPPASDDNSSV